MSHCGDHNEFSFEENRDSRGCRNGIESNGDLVLGRLDTMAGSPLPSSTPLGSVSSRRYRVKSHLLIIDPNNQYEDKIKPST
jgi:hypothetical protein